MSQVCERENNVRNKVNEIIFKYLIETELKSFHTLNVCFSDTNLFISNVKHFLKTIFIASKLCVEVCNIVSASIVHKMLHDFSLYFFFHYTFEFPVSLDSMEIKCSNTI